MEKQVSSLNTKLLYITGWKTPNIHGAILEKEESKWQTSMMAKIEKKKYCHLIEFPNEIFEKKKSLIFVFSDQEKKQGDNPDLNQNKENIFKKSIDSPANYLLSKPIHSIIYQGKIIPLSNLGEETKEASKFKKEKFMIVTDLDGTLVGDKSALDEFNKFWLSHCYLDSRKLLIYSTGRSLNSFVENLKPKENLLWPDYLICGCGASIYSYDYLLRIYVSDKEWEEAIKKNWNHELAANEFDSLPGLKRNTMDNKSPYVINYVAKFEDFEARKQELKNSQEKLSKINIFVSFHVSGTSSHRLIDITTSTAGKGNSLRYIASKTGFDIQDTYGFGDSLNDVELLEACGQSFIVSNSHSDLLDWHDKSSLSLKSKITKSSQNHAFALLEVLKNLISS